MRVVVSGASGFIGSHLVERLRGAGHDVLRLVRRAAQRPDEVRWDPSGGTLDPEDLNGVEGAVHLAGAGIGDKRWSEKRKNEIRDSRVDGTRLLATTLAKLDPLPRVLVSGSAVGYYGNRGDEVLTEESPSGDGFVAGVVRDWERAADPAREAGVRVVNIRSGIVLHPSGGVLKKQLPFFKLGVGGPLGHGRQWTSWISLDDELRAIEHALADASLDGPINATAPEPVTQKQLAKTLGKVLRRPAVVPVPAFALKLLFGSEAVDDVFMTSQRVHPTRLTASGFVFSHPNLETALRAML